MADLGAGDLKHRIAFARRPEQADDGFGNVEGEFIEHYVVSAALRPKFGGEQVEAERLSGRQPYTLTVRSSPEMRQVTTDWRARDVDTDELFNIRGIINPDQKKQWLEMLVDSGGASG